MDRPEPMDPARRLQLTAHVLADWQEHLVEQRAVPVLMVAMAVEGDAITTPLIRNSLLAPEHIVVLLRTLVEELDREGLRAVIEEVFQGGPLPLPDPAPGAAAPPGPGGG